MAKTNPDTNVPTAVMASTTNTRTRQAMLLGSSLEGGWNSPFPVGDQGTSFGPYQMHEGGALTALGYTPSQAEDPLTATKGMLPAYENAVNQVSDATWKNDPESAAEQAAFIAEAPAQDYVLTDGQSAIDTRWSQVQGVVTGHPGTGGSPPFTGTTTASHGNPADTWWGAILQGPQGIIQYAAKAASGSGGGSASNITKILDAIYNLIANPADALERGGLIIFGGIIIIVGLVIMTSGTRAGRIASTAATRGASSRISGSISGATEDRSRRLALAEDANRIGERKLALKEKREERLSSSRPAQKPAVGRHRKTAA